MAQGFDARRQFHEHAEAGRSARPASYHISYLVRTEERLPGIRLELLHPQRETPAAGVDIQDHRLDHLPLLQDLGGFFTRRVQERSETCTRPSIPSSISTNAPKSASFRTRPSTTEPML